MTPALASAFDGVEVRRVVFDEPGRLVGRRRGVPPGPDRLVVLGLDPLACGGGDRLAGDLGTAAEVRDVLADGPSLTRWWPAVYLSVHTLNEGDHDGVGSETALLTKGWLPYILRWRLRIVEPITDAGYALTATGDLDGAGRWTFAQDGPEVVVTYAAPHHLVADGPPLSHRRTAAGDAHEAGRRPTTPGVLLGMPSVRAR